MNFKGLSKCTSSNNNAMDKRKERREKEVKVEQRIEQREVRIGDGFSGNAVQNYHLPMKKEMVKNESDRSNITNDGGERKRERPEKVQLWLL